ncbi:MAG: hypothetical protein OEM81_11925 [Acidimicrobiia bacterium]|nr:hypothetical protein [Acidimicrobiia bacterium]MDH3398519.1 hypothetical protein [Acidimicrobiia bacterium]MDH5616870.1 hypothetical protein [Acidimicrobiia bacterium]
MKPRALILLVMVTALLLVSVAPVGAAPGTANASGTWDYVLTAEPEVKVAGPNMFIYGQDHGVWGGTFEGFTEEEFVVVCHPKAGFSFYKGEMTFNGTVEDESGTQHEGTMVIKTNAKQVSDTCEPSLDAVWEGHWVIIGGTEGLANVHGQGTFGGISFHAEYEGQIHFG